MELHTNPCCFRCYECQCRLNELNFQKFSWMWPLIQKVVFCYQDSQGYSVSDGAPSHSELNWNTLVGWNSFTLDKLNWTNYFFFRRSRVDACPWTRVAVLDDGRWTSCGDIQEEVVAVYHLEYNNIQQYYLETLFPSNIFSVFFVFFLTTCSDLFWPVLTASHTPILICCWTNLMNAKAVTVSAVLVGPIKGEIFPANLKGNDGQTFKRHKPMMLSNLSKISLLHKVFIDRSTVLYWTACVAGKIGIILWRWQIPLQLLTLKFRSLGKLNYTKWLCFPPDVCLCANADWPLI